MRPAHRTAWLAKIGYRVLRFWNGEVFTNTDGVVETIRLALLDPPPPLKGTFAKCVFAWPRPSRLASLAPQDEAKPKKASSS